MRLDFLALTLGTSLALGCAPDADEDRSIDSDESSQNEAAATVRLNPTRSYEDRLAIIELLEEQHPYPAGWADSRDGIRLQTEWQLESGRAVPGADGMLNSWWGNINWTLSVWQMRALQSRGEFANVELTIWKGYEPPAEVISSLTSFYDQIDAARAEADGMSSWQRHERQHLLQRSMWNFHVGAIRDGLRRNEGLRSSLPAGERRFAEAWAYTMVELIAIVNFSTDEATVGTINSALLPQRVLNETDLDLSESSDVPFVQRTGALAIVTIHEFEQWSGKKLETAVRAFASNQERAELAGHILAEALYEESPVSFLWWAIRKHTPEHRSGGTNRSADPGSSLTFTGTCEGNTLWWRDEGGEHDLDCSARGSACGWDEPTQRFDCLGEDHIVASEMAAEG